MQTHPEQKPNEVFLGNTKTATGLPPDLAAFESARIGLIAYSVDGVKLTAADAISPLFIGRHESDAYNQICEARLAKPSPAF